MDQVNTVTENKQLNRSRRTNSLPVDKIVNPLLGLINQELPKIEQVRDSLRGTPAEHDWGRARILNPELTLIGNIATLRMAEDSELHYRHLENSFRYRIGHTIGFVRVDGDWKISSDVLDDGGFLDPSPYVRKVFQHSSDVLRMVRPELARPLNPQGLQAPGSLGRGLRVPPNQAERLIDPAPAPEPDPYDGNAAADYAVTWARTRNPQYLDFDDDCTNFASQALRAGGWTDDVPNEWYEHVNSTERALTRSIGTRTAVHLKHIGSAWTLAVPLFNYGSTISKRFESTVGPVNIPNARPFAARRGDIAFSDWESDGKIDHTMVVTSLVGGGTDWRTVQISSHTGDEQNVALPEIERLAKIQNPQARPLFYVAHPRNS